MAYTSECPGLAAKTTPPDNSADLHPAFAARSFEALQAALGHAARAETHVLGRGHASEREQAVRRRVFALPEATQATSLRRPC